VFITDLIKIIFVCIFQISPPKKGKVERKWNEPTLSKEELEQLDFSKKNQETSNTTETPVHIIR
jgi:hypothetical protein